MSTEEKCFVLSGFSCLFAGVSLDKHSPATALAFAFITFASFVMGCIIAGEKRT